MEEACSTSGVTLNVRDKDHGNLDHVLCQDLILDRVLSFLSPREMVECVAVCKKWRREIKQEKHWKNVELEVTPLPENDSEAINVLSYLEQELILWVKILETAPIIMGFSETKRRLNHNCDSPLCVCRFTEVNSLYLPPSFLALVREFTFQYAESDCMIRRQSQTFCIFPPYMSCPPYDSHWHSRRLNNGRGGEVEHFSSERWEMYHSDFNLPNVRTIKLCYRFDTLFWPELTINWRKMWLRIVLGESRNLELVVFRIECDREWEALDVDNLFSQDTSRNWQKQVKTYSKQSPLFLGGCIAEILLIAFFCTPTCPKFEYDITF